MTIPANLIAGDTAEWSDTSADYPASDGWVMHHRFTPLAATGTAFELTATADGDDHLTAAATTTTALWVPGVYSWARWVAKTVALTPERYTLGSGSVTILANPASASPGYDARTPAKAALDACDEALRNYGSKAYLQSITLGDRSKTFRSPAEFLSFRSKLQAEVTREANLDRLRQGLPSKSQLLVRFGPRR